GNEAECCPFLCESNEKIDIQRIELLAEAQPPQVCRAQQTAGHRKGKSPRSYITVFDRSSWQLISTVTSGMRFRALFESLTARIDKVLIGENNPHSRLHPWDKLCEKFR